MTLSARHRLLPLALLSWAVAPEIAFAGPDRLEAALSRYDAAQLSQALVLFEQALKEGGNSRADLARIYLFLGVLRAGARDAAGAEAAFLAMCSLEPELPVPDGSSPVLKSPLENAARACAK